MNKQLNSGVHGNEAEGKPLAASGNIQDDI